MICLRRVLAARGLAGAALAASVALTPAVAPGCELQVRSPGDGVMLATVPMGWSRSFELGYLHSVTRTPVLEALSIEGDMLVQRRIEFREYGPGMPSEAQPGERFQLNDGRFILDGMSRHVGVLRMRVDPAQHQVLDAGGQSVSLTQWGARSLSVQALDCE